MGINVHPTIRYGYDVGIMWEWTRIKLLAGCFTAFSLFTLSAFGLTVDQPIAGSYKEVGLPIAQTYDPDDFNSHVQNWAVSQAQDGRMLVGNGNGLLVWDGELWHRYSTPNQSRVRALVQWHDGRIYVGTVNEIGYYAADDKGALVFTSLLDSLDIQSRRFGEVWSIASTDKHIIFSSSESTLLYNGESLEVIPGITPGSNRIFNIEGRFILFPDAGAPLEVPTADMQLVQDYPIEGLPIGAKVRDIIESPDGQRLIVTAEQGVFRWTEAGAELILAADAFGEDVGIYSAYRASDGYYYLGSLRHGLFILTPDFQLVRRYGIKDGIGLDTILDINEDSQGGIWLSGLPGVSRITPAHRYSHYGTKEQNIGAADLQAWRNTPVLAGFSIYSLSVAENSLDSPGFSALENWGHETNYVLDLDDEALVAAAGGVFSLTLGPDGLPKASGAEKPFIEVMFANHLVVDSLASNAGGPVVYAATSLGLYRLVKETGVWKATKLPGIDEPLLYLNFDTAGDLWAGTSNQRLFRLPRAQLDNNQPSFSLFDGEHGLGPNNVFPLKIGDKFFFGTDGGLFDFDDKRKPEFQPAEGFPEIFHTPEVDFYRWMIDSNDNFWYRIGNHTGVAWRQSDKRLIADEQITQPLPFRSATGFFEARDGAIWISQADGGVYRLGPDLVQARGTAVPHSAALAITEVQNLVSGEILYGGHGELNIPALPVGAGSLRIRFALSDFSLPEKTLYRSRLSGSERWSDWQRETWRDFTRLQGGDYVFELQARDGWGREQSLTGISFNVLKPWYLSPWAWALYIVLLALALVLAGWLGQRWRTARLQERNLVLQQTVDERTSEVRARVEELKQTQELKDRFFANVSHEFRTPLTLTIEPLEEVVRDHTEGMGEQGVSLTRIALRNARKMLGLIGEVLDINRLEAGSLRLIVAENDLADLLQRVVQRFQPWIKRQNQTLELGGAEEPVMLWYDQDQMDRMVSNLLSNAIKYSGKDSKIKIQLSANADFVELQVLDNGPGIAEDKQEKIFERYYQGETAADNVWPGTGIGLSLVRELAELHHGRITLDTNTEGASFRLHLLRGNRHFDQAELNRDGVPQFERQQETDSEQASSAVDMSAEDVTSVLIVDDNAELRHFLALRLASRYRVLEAENGRLGVEMALGELPDLIISDVMMPEMDGIELARTLKNNEETATIPIILLTAKSTKRDTVEGLQAGADDYLTKPFDTSELIARVAGLIASRRLIRVAALAEFQPAETTEPQADAFQQQLDLLILENLQDSGLNVVRLSELMNMDRTSLYRKCQKSTEMSPVAYIRQSRMQVAARLLQQADMSVSEVAYATGFESISYFSRVFRQEFGTPPSSFSRSVG